MEDKRICKICGGEVEYRAKSEGEYYFKIKKDGTPFKRYYCNGVSQGEGFYICNDCGSTWFDI